MCDGSVEAWRSTTSGSARRSARRARGGEQRAGVIGAPGAVAALGDELSASRIAPARAAG